MLLKIYENNPSPREVERVVKCLRDGGVIIYPTDGVYALGCSMQSGKAVARLKQICGKSDDRLTVVCRSLSEISELARVSNPQFKILKRNLPGPFTFILPAGNRLPKIFKNRKEVGIRIPDNSIAQEICEALGAPLLSTSLKVDEREETEYMTLPELIDEKWGDLVDLVIDGGEGDTEQSTIVNCVDGEAEIVRQGKGWI